MLTQICILLELKSFDIFAKKMPAAEDKIFLVCCLIVLACKICILFVFIVLMNVREKLPVTLFSSKCCTSFV